MHKATEAHDNGLLAGFHATWSIVQHSGPLTKAQANAIKSLLAIEAALVAGDWPAARDASIKLAALAAERASRH